MMNLKRLKRRQNNFKWNKKPGFLLPFMPCKENRNNIFSLCNTNYANIILNNRKGENMRKKAYLFITAMSLSVMLFGGCGNKNNNNSATSPGTENGTGGSGNNDSGTGNNNNDDSLADDLEDGADDIMDGADDAGSDVRPPGKHDGGYQRFLRKERAGGAKDCCRLCARYLPQPRQALQGSIRLASGTFAGRAETAPRNRRRLAQPVPHAVRRRRAWHTRCRRTYRMHGLGQCPCTAQGIGRAEITGRDARRSHQLHRNKDL